MIYVMFIAGPILIDIASELMKFPKHILNAAQRLNNSCTELVRDLELTASFAPALQVSFIR